jgi:archaeal flagellar protein FlaJ
MVYRLLSKFYPKRAKKAYGELLGYLKIKINPDVYLGFTVLIGLLVGLAGAFIVGTFYHRLPFWILWIALFFIIEILIYVPLMLKVDKISKNVEKMLPDALQIMSSHLKSGLTVDQALLSSSRPEFGRFGLELDQIGKEVAIGKPIEEALIASTKRIKSEKYKKTMELVASGLRSGGELAKLLDQTSSNLKHQDIVDQKVRSNVMMYTIFIFFAICGGAPVLYGLSSYLVEVLTSIFSQIDMPSAATSSFAMPMGGFSSISISSEFVTSYIITSIIASSIMGGFIIGLIARGNAKYGFRYIPILILVALLVFFLVRSIMAGFMGGLIDI